MVKPPPTKQKPKKKKRKKKKVYCIKKGGKGTKPSINNNRYLLDIQN